MDEKSKQLLADTRQPIKASPGKVEKYDYEYKRKGTCNIFVAVEPKWLSFPSTECTFSGKTSSIKVIVIKKSLTHRIMWRIDEIKLYVHEALWQLLPGRNSLVA